MKNQAVPTAYLRSVGCISPHGVGLAKLQEALAQSKPCPSKQSFDTGDGGGLLTPVAAGWIEPLEAPQPTLNRPGGRAVRFSRLDRLSQLAFIAAGQALQEAKDLPPDPDTAGIALGSAFGCHLTNELFQNLLFHQGPTGASPALFAHTLPSAATATISIHWGLRGSTLTFVNGPCAGISALAVAAEMIERGESTWMLSGAVDVLSPTLLRSSSEGRMLSEGGIFWVLTPCAEGAMGRILGTECAFGKGSIERAAEGCLRRSGLSATKLRRVLRFKEAQALSVPAPELPWPDLPFDDSTPQRMEKTYGYCMAAAPLLGMATMLNDTSAFPLLTIAHDRQGLSCAVCIDEVAPC
jgi:hypothetical protein